MKVLAATAASPSLIAATSAQGQQMPQLDVRMVAAALEIDSMDEWIATLILMATAVIAFFATGLTTTVLHFVSMKPSRRSLPWSGPRLQRVRG